MQEIRAISIFFMIVISLGFVAGCQSRPVLPQVDSNAAEKPINTPEIASQLTKQYQK